MNTVETQEVTLLLQAWSDGNPQAAEQVMPLIYEHLRRLAQASMAGEREGHTLQPTALVHEAYLRLAGGVPVQWEGRAHFYRLAARAMRRILVDHARAQRAGKRGGLHAHLPLRETDALEPAAGDDDDEMDLVALDAALEQLAEDHPRQSQVVELRFFGGMEARDVAEVLQVTERTIKRDWQFARLWLHRAVGQERDQG